MLQERGAARSLKKDRWDCKQKKTKANPSGGGQRRKRVAKGGELLSHRKRGGGESWGHRNKAIAKKIPVGGELKNC